MRTHIGASGADDWTLDGKKVACHELQMLHSLGLTTILQHSLNERRRREYFSGIIEFGLVGSPENRLQAIEQAAYQSKFLPCVVFGEDASIQSDVLVLPGAQTLIIVPIFEFGIENSRLYQEAEGVQFYLSGKMYSDVLDLPSSFISEPSPLAFYRFFHATEGFR